MDLLGPPAPIQSLMVMVMVMVLEVQIELGMRD